MFCTVPLEIRVLSKSKQHWNEVHGESIPISSTCSVSGTVVFEEGP